MSERRAEPTETIDPAMIARVEETLKRLETQNDTTPAGRRKRATETTSMLQVLITQFAKKAIEEDKGPPEKTVFGMSVGDAAKLLIGIVTAASSAYLAIKSDIKDVQGQADRNNTALIEVREEMRGITKNNSNRLETMDREAFERESELRQAEKRIEEVYQSTLPKWKRKK